MPAQEKLSQTEQYLAYTAGIGIVIAIAALILIGLGTLSSNNGVGLLLVGLALLVIGIGGWLIMLRPWEKFDDLKTPHFTGHEEHAAAPAGEVEAAELAEAAAPVAAAKPVEAEPVKAAPPVEAAAPAPKAAEAAADDLTLIEGIGPKSAEALQAAGITTFAQVAKLSPQELEKAVKDRKVRLVGSAEQWPHQAEIAATGDLTALEEYQRRLKGESVADDLTLIEGIGPKSAEALQAAGITTFAQMVKLSPQELEKAVKDRKVRLVGSTETWPMQAELAAKGDLSALEALQARIKGGVLVDKE
jgi:predicted flap endonuclease-1-like 5' DNA nuclease